MSDILEWDESWDAPRSFRKRPVVVQAVRLGPWNHGAAWKWITDNGGDAECDDFDIVIHTLEGPMTASVGNFVVRGVKGEFYPVRADIFFQTYEESRDDASTDAEDGSTAIDDDPATPDEGANSLPANSSDRLRQAAVEADRTAVYLHGTMTPTMHAVAALLRAVVDDYPCCCVGSDVVMGCPWHHSRPVTVTAALTLAGAILGDT